MIDRFNIRVYGILLRKGSEVLLSNEVIFGKKYTKFPGGGLEFGEGMTEGLVREYQEELNVEIEIGGHLYTTDLFQVPSRPAAYRDRIRFSRPQRCQRFHVRQFPDLRY